jgi:hypothetical protein
MKIQTQPFDYQRLRSELKPFMPCEHRQQLIGRKIKSNGQNYFRLQCAHCGCPLSGQISFKRVNELKNDGVAVTEWDESKAMEYDNNYWRYSRPIVERINIERRQSWWRQYNEYVDSDEWKMKAARVLQRVNYVCEKCNSARAIHAHHLSYARVGDEHMEDLQARCFKCHDEDHGGMLSMNRFLDQLDAEFGVGR